MQPARVEVYLAVTEFGSRVQRRQDQFQGWPLVSGVQIDGDTTAIVADRDSIAVFVQRHRDGIGEAVQIFIDSIIDDLPNEMMQSLGIDAADVHRRPFAYGFQTFENTYVFGCVSSGTHRQILRRKVLYFPEREGASPNNHDCLRQSSSAFSFCPNSRSRSAMAASQSARLRSALPDQCRGFPEAYPTQANAVFP